MVWGFANSGLAFFFFVGGGGAWYVPGLRVSIISFGVWALRILAQGVGRFDRAGGP